MTSALRFAAVGWLLAVAVCICPSITAIAADGVKTIRLTEEVGDWVLDPATGRIFATLSGENAVVEFDAASGKKVRQFVVGANPRRLIVKRKRLIVDLETGPTLVVIDLEKNRVEGNLQLEGKLEQLTCSQVDNPYVYAICDKPKMLYQVNLDKREVSASRGIGNWLFTPSHMELTPDGKYAAVDNSAWVRPTSVGLLQVNEERFRFTFQANFRQDTGPIVADSTSRYWTLGKYVLKRYPTENPPQLRKFTGAMTAIHSSLDLVAGFQSEKNVTWLILQKFSDGLEIKRLELPATPVYPKTRGNNFQDHPEIRFDEARNRVFVGWGNVAHVVDLAALKLLLAPVVRLQLPDKMEIHTDRETKIPLRLTNSTLRDKARFELIDPPPGVHIDKQGNLVWKADYRAVGHYLLKVRASVGEISDEVPIKTNVRGPNISLGVVARRLAIDRQGKFAVVAGLPIDRVAEGDPDQMLDELSLLDIEKQQVVARRKLTAAVATIHLDGQSVYWSARGGKSLHKLHLKDLSDDKKVFLDYPIVYVAGIPVSRLIVTTQEAMHCLNSTDLKEVPFPGVTPIDSEDNFYGFDRRENRRHRDIVRKLSDGVYFDSVALDDMGRPRLVVQCDEIPSVSLFDPEQRRDQRGWQRGGHDLGPRLWGRLIYDRRLYSKTNFDEPLALWEGYTESVALQNYPVAATMKLIPRKNKDFLQRMYGYEFDYQWKLGLDFHELVEGKPIQTRVLSDRPIPRKLFKTLGQGNEGPLMAVAGDKVVVAYWDHLFVVRVPEAYKEIPQPVSFVRSQGPLHAKVGEVVQRKFQSVGGKGDKTYALSDKSPGVSIDARDGKVDIDTKAVWNRFLEGYSDYDGDEQTAHLRNRIAKGQAAFERIFGQAPGGIPVSVDLTLTARDEEGQSDRITSQFFVIGPSDELDAKIAAAKAVAEKEWKLAAEKRRQRQQPAPVGQNADLTADFVLALRRRDQNLKNLGSIETRLQRARVDLQRTSQLLQRLDATPPNRPAAPSSRRADVDKQIAATVERIDQLDKQISRFQQSSRHNNGYITWLLILSSASAVALVMTAIFFYRSQGAKPAS